MTPGIVVTTEAFNVHVSGELGVEAFNFRHNPGDSGVASLGFPTGGAVARTTRR